MRKIKIDGIEATVTYDNPQALEREHIYIGTSEDGNPVVFKMLDWGWVIEEAFNGAVRVSEYNGEAELENAWFK